MDEKPRRRTAAYSRARVDTCRVSDVAWHGMAWRCNSVHEAASRSSSAAESKAQWKGPQQRALRLWALSASATRAATAGGSLALAEVSDIIVPNTQTAYSRARSPRSRRAAARRQPRQRRPRRIPRPLPETPARKHDSCSGPAEARRPNPSRTLPRSRGARMPLTAESVAAGRGSVGIPLSVASHLACGSV